MEIFIKIAPIIISAIALGVSIKALRNQTPKIKVSIENRKHSAYFGATKIRRDGPKYVLGNYVAVVRFVIKNVSHAPITISDIYLISGKTRYDIASPSNEYWNEITFYYKDILKIGEDEHGFTSDGSCLDYGKTGIHIPCILQPYDVHKVVAVFNSFPKSASQKVRAILNVDTAIGKIKKSVLLMRYDENYDTGEWDEIKKFQDSY